MPKKKTPKPDATDAEDLLTISPEKVCYIIIKAREFDAKDVDSEQEAGSNATDDLMVGVLEDSVDDPAYAELVEFISELSEDEQLDLVALMWLGREENTLEDFKTLREEAANARGADAQSTARYLLGTPLVADYLEEGLAMFGKSCEEYELGRL